MYAIVVHGGAGQWHPDSEPAALRGVQIATQSARSLLAGGGTALDAVVAAVSLLEDDPTFNAGTGSVLNLEGEVEMDAGVMDAQGLRTGNVAALRRVRHPVQVARAVMEQTDHCLLVGEGALRFARALGFPDHDPVTPARREGWSRALGHMHRSGDAYLTHLRGLLHRHPGLPDGGPQGTVGAVALDTRGGLAAATSTGGVTLKLPGRVGDSALPGAGNYAGAEAAVSATGKGELMMRYLTAKAVCDRVAAGESVPRAVHGVLAQMAEQVGSDVGMIAVDRFGTVAVAHLTPAMAHAYATATTPVQAFMGASVLFHS